MAEQAIVIPTQSEAIGFVTSEILTLQAERRNTWNHTVSERLAGRISRLERVRAYLEVAEEYVAPVEEPTEEPTA